MELDESMDSEGKENQQFQVQVDGYILWYKNVLFPYGSLYFQSDSIRNKASVEGGKEDDYGDLRKTKKRGYEIINKERGSKIQENIIEFPTSLKTIWYLCS